ncbi:MAG: glycosyl hydrolase-related protein [Verrucomicrobia bacterium]|nr:glycosyl hydrolase-related protein [Verrucomicrobiota bacterium]MDA1086604.1 glycosyl hydrolase-related protein [Verrucomicrobiota bacterium]
MSEQHDLSENRLPDAVHIVPSFHYDVAYLESFEAYLPRCFHILDTALAILEAHAEYTFLVEQVILLEAYWERHPQKREALKRFAAEGRLGVAPGMYIMPDMNHIDGESTFLQAKFGRRWLDEKLGIAPSVCWIADCWGHHAQLPQILKQSGYTTYAFWRCMRRDVQQNYFRWRGLDGSSINTLWLSRGYGNIRFPSEDEVVNALDLDLAECGTKQIEKLVRDIGTHGGEQVLLCNGGDFMTPQSSAPDVVRRHNAEGVLPPLGFSLPENVMEEITWSDTREVEGEFNSAFQGTFAGNIEIKQQNRRLVNRMLAAETFAAISGRHLPDAEGIWKILLKQQFHDIICGTICDEALADTRDEFALAEKRLEAALLAIEDEEGIPALFNPLSFPREVVLEGDSGAVRVEMPAFGFAARKGCKPLPDPEAVALPVTLETDYFRARIDETGYVVSLIENESAVELIRSHASPFGALAMQLDNGDLWLNFEGPLNAGSVESSLTQNHPDPYDRSEPGSLVNRSTFNPDVKVARAFKCGEERLVVEQEGELLFWRIRFPFRTRLVLDRGSRLLSYETHIEPVGRNYRLRVAFPTRLEDGCIRHEIPFGIQERGSHEHVAQNWIDYASGNTGLALLNAGTPGNNVDDGVLLLTLFRSVAMEYKTPSAGSFQEGVPHSFRYAILPHGSDSDPEIVRAGLAFNRACVPCSCAEERLGAQQWRLEGADSALVSTLRANGDDVFVRLYESCGRSAEAVLKPSSGFSLWAPANGLEQAEGPFKPIQDGISISLNPFEIRGLLLRSGPE